MVPVHAPVDTVVHSYGLHHQGSSWLNPRMQKLRYLGPAGDYVILGFPHNSFIVQWSVISCIGCVFHPTESLAFEDKKNMHSYLGLIPPNLAQAQHLGMFNELRCVHERGND